MTTARRITPLKRALRRLQLLLEKRYSVPGPLEESEVGALRPFIDRVIAKWRLENTNAMRRADGQPQLKKLPEYVQPIGSISSPNWTGPALLFTEQDEWSRRRAQTVYWTLDLENGTVHHADSQTPRLDPRDEAKRLAPLVVARKRDRRLEWKADGSVQVRIGQVIPITSGASRTVERRRFTFRQSLDLLLAQVGWRKLSENRYTCRRNGKRGP